VIPTSNQNKCSSSEAVAPNKCSSSEAVAPDKCSSSEAVAPNKCSSSEAVAPDKCSSSEAVAPNKTVNSPSIIFATPRKLPKLSELGERVVVLDIAFASNAGGSSFEKSTGKFIAALGSRLLAWVDHHDSEHHRLFANDPRFLLRTKAQHGACPELVTEALVARFPACDTIVAHGDFDGVASAAKWLRGGLECYPGCDADAFAIDTRSAEASALGQLLDRALKVDQRPEFLRSIVEFLAAGATDVNMLAQLEVLGRSAFALEQHSRELAQCYQHISEHVVLVDVSEVGDAFDRTLLLLLGQARAKVAAMVVGESVTFAAHYRSGIDFLALFGLTGGMPTVVSIPSSRLQDALDALQRHFSVPI
jgi:hypothetical protein